MIQANGAAPPLASPTKTHSIPPFDTDLPEIPPVDPARANEATIVRTNLAASEAKATAAKEGPPPKSPQAPPAAAAASPPPPPPPAAAPAPAPAKAKEKDDDAFEALQRRFAELKRR